MQCLFWGKGFSGLVDQQTMLQCKLNRRPGNPPRAGIVGFRRKQILSAPDDRPQTGKGVRIVPQQALHREASDKSNHAAHEDGGEAEQQE